MNASAPLEIRLCLIDLNSIFKDCSVYGRGILFLPPGAAGNSKCLPASSTSTEKVYTKQARKIRIDTSSLAAQCSPWHSRFEPSPGYSRGVSDKFRNEEHTSELQSL